jgi:hypothetical protein
MKLTAMVMVGPGEDDRYLAPFFAHLLDFCDEVRVRNEGGAWDVPRSLNLRRVVAKNVQPTFFEHEGRARQELLEWAMEGQPTHLLAIDADEFIADGQALRAAMEKGSHTGVWKLTMTEIWGAGEDRLAVRQDGDWKPRPIGIAFAVPPDHHTNRQTRRHWRMHDRALACGRTPLWITMAGNRTTSEAVTEILHFGWACEADRAARYERYVIHDGGQHHANKHLNSIMWGDDQVQTSLMKWPPALDKETIVKRANRP